MEFSSLYNKVNPSLEYLQIDFDSDDYWKALRMREIVLRLPLNLRYTIENIELEQGELIFVAKVLEEVVANVQYIVEGNKAKLRQVATKSKFQGQGIGKKLAKFSEGYLQKINVNEVYCHARKSAIPFYIHQSFQIVSEEFFEVNLPHVKMSKFLS